MLSFFLFPLIGIAIALTPIVAMAGASGERAVSEQDALVTSPEDS